MATSALDLPDAKDMDSSTIVPTRELESCNHLLDDHAALMRFHDDHGYILLRNVLDPDSVEEARQAMFSVMEGLGLIEPGATVPVWTGTPCPPGMEESPAFSGIARKLIEHPNNLKLMEKILGEPASIIPIVQYRAYPPGGPVTNVHQDGFYSPGIKNYKPVWTPLADCEREVGGLMVAVDQCNSGFFHNVAKSPAHIPEGAIPEDAWATTDYYPGDILILNPFAPHGSMPNRSNRCRVTLDTRVQSAADPRVLLADIVEANSDSIRVKDMNGEVREFSVDDDTFIRIDNPGVRQKREDYWETADAGKRVVVVFDGDQAITLRRASDN